MASTAPAATHAQIEALLNFMSEHNDLARGGARGTKGRRAKQLWGSLCNSLNSMGGCIKSVEEWQSVWADRVDLAREAAGDIACAAGGDPLDIPNPSEEELRIISMMGKGFGERQIGVMVPIFPEVGADRKDLAREAAGAARPTGGDPLVIPTPSKEELRITGALLPVFPEDVPESRDPATNLPTQAPAAIPANPLSQEHQPSVSTEAPKRKLPRQNRQTLNSRRARPRVRRHFIADPVYSRIIQMEEQSIQVAIRRNELLSEIKDAIVELGNLVREYIARH